jgi:hypothetical protein
MIVHRILDAVFRTLDAVDAVRARVGAVVGAKDPQPPSAWPADGGDDVRHDSAAVRAAYVDAPSVSDWQSASDPDGGGEQKKKNGDERRTAATTAKKAAKATTAEPTKTTKATTATTKTTTTAKATKPAKKGPQTPRPKKEKPASKTPSAASRKGSVDRSGKDFDSPRARAVKDFLSREGLPIVSVDADLDGKKTLARVLWAMIMADDAKIEHGLTAADASALLSTVAGVEVFATNVARTFRDEADLFQETTPDGRSKRYTVTAAGRARAVEIASR